jgi:hypothetical protein
MFKITVPAAGQRQGADHVGAAHGCHAAVLVIERVPQEIGFECSNVAPARETVSALFAPDNRSHVRGADCKLLKTKGNPHFLDQVPTSSGYFDIRNPFRGKLGSNIQTKAPASRCVPRLPSRPRDHSRAALAIDDNKN